MDILGYLQYLFIDALFLLGLIALIQQIEKYVNENEDKQYMNFISIVTAILAIIALAMTINAPRMFVTLGAVQILYVVVVLRMPNKWGVLPIFIEMLGVVYVQGFFSLKLGWIEPIGLAMMTILLLRGSRNSSFYDLYWRILPALATSLIVIFFNGGTALSITYFIISFHAFAGVTSLFSYMLNRDRTEKQTMASRAYHDELTGILNYRAFNEDLRQAFDRYQETGERYVLYTMDIDRFKDINDGFGHLNGNKVLQQVANQFKVIINDYPTYHALVYRTGGEEFSILILNVAQNRDLSIMVTRRIQREIRDMRFKFGGRDLNITISIGQDNNQPDDKQYLDIYGRADKYLYMSKQNGRDRITIQGEVLE